MFCNTDKKSRITQMSRISLRVVGTVKKTLATVLSLTVLPMTALAADRDDTTIRVINAQERLRMQDYVDKHVYPRDIVSGFRTATGDDVDCVDIYAQPALRLPEMKGHVIEFAPKTFPNTLGQSRETLREDDDASDHATDKTSQTLGNPNERCPQGSVPIRRLTIETLQRFKTLEDFRKKVPSHIGRVRDFNPEHTDDEQTTPDDTVPPRIGASSLHQYAHAYQYVANWGAESVLNLWNPYTEKSNEFSLSQIWVVRGSGSSRETVETGWQKYRDLYGDWNARLFIYFTPDNYGSGGCYNLTCGAFVQTNNTIYIGGAFSSYSQLGGSQQTVKLLWYKDGTNGHWWLRYGDIWVGYYPRTRFDAYGLRDQAALIDFGGELIDLRTDGRHTYTDMGSGRWPYEGFGYAAYQRALKYVDTSNYYRDAASLTATRTDSQCYDISLYSASGSWGRYFYFGGAGYNTNCQ